MAEAPPVDRLPTEVLADIFSLVPGKLPSMVPGPGSDWERSSDVGQLRPLTAVCRAWRGAAIGTPSLWSTALVCQTPDKESPWYKACLEHSGQGPLDVFADLATRRGVTKFLMQNGARVRDLCLVYPDNQDSVRYGPMQLALTLPNLERCTISGGLIVRSSLCRFPPYALFPNSPRLSALRLVTCDFLPSKPFPALTHLCIVRCNARIEDLLVLISKSPHLRVLKMHLNGPDYRWIDVPSLELEAWRAGPKLASPQLQELEVIDYLPVSGFAHAEPDHNRTIWYNVLSAVTIPPACVTRIGAVSSEHLLETLNRFNVGGRATHAYLNKRWPYRETNQSGFAMHALGQDNPLDVVLGLSYIATMPGPELYSHMSGAFATFTALRRLWMHVDFRAGRIVTDMLRGVLADLPALEFLALFASDYTRTFVPCTELLPASGLASDPDNVVRCPRLTTLALNPRGWPCTAPADGEIAFALDFARARAAAGAPLARLLLCENEYEPEGGQPQITVWYEGSRQMRDVGPAPAKTTVLREYDAAGALVRTHDGDALVVAERMWAEGVEWSGPGGDWTHSFR